MLPANTAEEYSLHNLFSVNIFLGLTSIVYRLPQQKTAHVYSGNLFQVENTLLPKASFLFSDFQNGNSIFALVPEFYQPVTTNMQAVDFPVLEIPATKSALPSTMPKQNYTAMVQKAVNEIIAGKLEKVVLSRPYKTELPENYNPLTFFTKLTETYPDAFVYLLMSPELGNWIA
ncbi:MAG: chorismate-binding protein, partial [Bacteroidia bacterium]